MHQKGDRLASSARAGEAGRNEEKWGRGSPMDRDTENRGTGRRGCKWVHGPAWVLALPGCRR